MRPPHMEWTILEQLDWKLMSVMSVDWCHAMLDLLVVFMDVTNDNGGNESRRNGKRHNTRKRVCNIDKVRECTLTHLETVMESNRMVAPSLAAWAAVLRALDDYNAYGHDKQCITAYKEMVCRVLPFYGEEEVNAVRFCF